MMMFFDNENKSKIEIFHQSNPIISHNSEQYYCEIENITLEEKSWYKVLHLSIHVYGDGSLKEVPSPLGSTLWIDEEQGIGCLPEDTHTQFIGYKIIEQDMNHLKAIVSYDLNLFLPEDETAIVENRLFFSYASLHSGFSRVKLNLPNIQPWLQPNKSNEEKFDGKATGPAKKVIQSFLQPEEIISKKSDNSNYYVIINKVDIEYDVNDPNLNRMSVLIDLSVFGDGSLGPVPNPLHSLLMFTRSRGTECLNPTIIERSINKIHAVCEFTLFNRSDRLGLKKNLFTFQYGCTSLNFQPIALVTSGFIDPDDADRNEEEVPLEGESVIGRKRMKGAGSYSSFHQTSDDILRLEDGLYLITFVVGENGCDGHGKSNIYGIKSNIPPIELQSSYQQGVDRLGYDITRYCQEYEDNKIHPSFQQALRLKGFVLPTILSFRNEEVEKSLEYIDSDTFVEIFLFTVRLGNPSFGYSKVTIPSFEIGGYGLYY